MPAPPGAVVIQRQTSLYCPQDRGCGHVPNALRASKGVYTKYKYKYKYKIYL